MYLQHFGLIDYPFRLTPDTEYLFMSAAHSRAKAYMDYAIFNREGFVVITGEIGSGKTTLVKKLLSEIDNQNILVAKVFQTQLNDVEILQSILLEFGINPFNANKVELLNLINQFLINRYVEGKQILLIIDDAQNLSKRALKEVALLSGIETQKEKILHTILVGQTELNASLEMPEMEHLLQRVSFRYHVRPLNEKETIDYIKYRMRIAGTDANNVFSDEVMKLVYDASGGTPRLINTLCDKAMTIAYADDKTKIDKKLFDEVIEELQWNKEFYKNNRNSSALKYKKNKISPELLENNKTAKILEEILTGINSLTKHMARIADAFEDKNKLSITNTDNLDLDLSGKPTINPEKTITNKTTIKTRR